MEGWKSGEYFTIPLFHLSTAKYLVYLKYRFTFARMIIRKIKTEILQLLDEFPAVGILGPRQVGKTTLAKEIAKGFAQGSVYLDLELPSNIAKLSDPESFFQFNADKLIILDEIQRMPELFQVLRGIIDQRRDEGKRSGQFLILGSASLELIKQSSESLAGRIAYKQLPGLTLTEIPDHQHHLQQLWLRGGFPDGYGAKNDHASFEWRQQFISTYLERDIPQLGPRIPAMQLKRMWTMLAHNNAGILNTAQLAAGLGITNPTARKYIDLLEDLLLVRTLYPWAGNVGKRLIKAPKVYIRDSGITHALLGIETLNDLLGHPVCGASWEGFVIENILSELSTNAQAYFYRTSAGAEIDLFIEKGNHRFAVEIKRSLSPSISKGFHNGCNDVKATQKFVVYPGEESYSAGDGVKVIGLYDFMKYVRD